MLSTITSTAQPITGEQFAQLLEDSEILESLDDGVTLLHKCVHPQRGEIVLVSEFRGPYKLSELH